MKRFVVFLVLCVFVLSVKAQKNPSEKVKTYIEIYSMHKFSTPTLTIDTGEGKGSETYKTEDGQIIKFHSAIGAVNWFVSNGWVLESQHMATCNDRNVKMYVVSKEVPKEQVVTKQSQYLNK